MRSIQQRVPSFSLYGEQADSRTNIDALHIEDIQLRSRKYLWRIGTHRHTLLTQCVLVTAGPVAVILEGLQRSFDGPAVMLIPAGAVHSFRFGCDTRGYVLSLNLQQVLSIVCAAHRAPIEALFAVPRAIDLSLDTLLAARATEQFECLLNEFRRPQRLLEPIGSWLACCALWGFAVRCGAEMPVELRCGQDLDRLQQFRLLVEAHFAHHWPVERYARQLGMSETRLNRICRRLTGGTGFDLLQQRLALEARRRLIHVQSSVGQIASELGFKDSAYFCRFFRRHAGFSPNEFRRRHPGG